MSASSAALRRGLALAQWEPIDLWRAALGTGGHFTRHDIEALLDGGRAATPTEHDILASTLNDHFLDQDGGHSLRYWSELDG